MKSLIGIEDRQVEKEFNFNWYVEFKPKRIFGFNLEEHDRLIEQFLRILPQSAVKILKLNDGVVEDEFDLTYDEVINNVQLIGHDEGLFYDEELEISYAVVTDTFFATIQKGMIFWSSTKEGAEQWNQLLKNAGLNSHGVNHIGDEDE